MAYTLSLTTAGQAKIMAAITAGSTVTLTHIAVGSSATLLTSASTALGQERYRAVVNNRVVAGNVVTLTGVVPDTQGGWFIREIGVFDVDGTLIAFAQFPETYKPLASLDSTAANLTITAALNVINASAIAVTVSAAALVQVANKATAAELRAATPNKWVDAKESQTELNTRLAGLIEPKGLAFDGTAGAAVNIPAVGTGDFEVQMVARTTSAFPGSPNLTFFLDKSSSGANAFVFYTDHTGTLRVALSQINTPGGSTAPLSVDTVYILGYKRASGVGTLYINGVEAGTFADTNNYSASTDLIGSAGYMHKSASALRFFNRALTDAERTALIARGLVPLTEQRGGSMAAANTVSMTQTAGSITGFSSTASSFSGTSAGYCEIHPRDLNSTSIAYQARKKIRVKVATVTGEVNLFIASVFSGVVTNGFDQTFTLTEASNVRFFVTTTGVSIGLTGVEIIPLGTLYELGDASQGHGPVIPDTSGNGNHTILPGDGVTGGVARISPRLGEQEIGPFDIAGTGNAIVGGVDVARIPTGYAVVGARMLATAGSTGNYRLGTASAGQQIVADVAVSTAVDQAHTIVNPRPIFTSATRLWQGRSGTLAAGSRLWMRIAPSA